MNPDAKRKLREAVDLMTPAPRHLVVARLPDPGQPARWQRAAAVASACLLMLAVGGMLLYIRNAPNAKSTTATTPAASPAATAPVRTPTPSPEVTAPVVVPPGSPPVTSPAPKVPRCQANQLALALHPLGLYTGHRVMAFVLTNKTSTTCFLYGYPGVGLLDAAGHPIPVQVIRGGGQAAIASAPQTVQLAPGGTASFTAEWAALQSGPTPCPTSAQVQVTPPDDFDQLTIPEQIGPCGFINVTPVFPGGNGAPGQS